MVALSIEDLNPPEVVAAVRGTKSKTGRYTRKRVLYNDYLFDSQVEYERYRVLALRLHAGEIANLRVHPKYTLIPSFRSQSGRSIPAVKFTPDFEYVEGNVHVIEDVKAWRKRKRGHKPYCTPDFTLRRKLFQRDHPTTKVLVAYCVGGTWHEEVY